MQSSSCVEYLSFSYYFMFRYLHMQFLKASFWVKNYVCPLGSLFSYAYELATVFIDFNKIAIIWIK